MARESAVSDEALARALGLYAGMVDKVVSDPERWLGADGDEAAPPTSVPGRVLGAVRDRTFGRVTPASAEWEQQPVDKRVDWWVDRIGISAGLAAAAPRFAGALSDRLPVQAALGASAAGLAVSAVAREHGVTAPQDWVPLLATVLFDRDLRASSAAVPPPEEAEGALTADEDDEPASRMAALGRGAQNAAGTLWRLARIFLELQHLLDERPRGSFLARVLGKVPVLGLAGGWLDERGGIRKAAEETGALLG
jgi:transposase-like protein